MRLGNAVCDNIGDGCGRFNGCYANLSDELRAAFHQQLSIADHSILVSKVEHDEIPCRIDGENSALKPVAHSLLLAVLFLFRQSGKLGTR